MRVLQVGVEWKRSDHTNAQSTNTNTNTDTKFVFVSLERADQEKNLARTN
jgi:hypothetical protein